MSKKRLVLGLALCASLLVYVLWPTAKEAPQEMETAAAPEPSAPKETSPPRFPGEEKPRDFFKKELLTAVKIEKPEICRGESTWMELQADEEVIGEDARYQTLTVENGLPRYSFGKWFRFQAPKNGHGRAKVIAIGEDGLGGIDSRDVEIEVKDCDLSPDTLSAYELPIDHKERGTNLHEFSVERAAAMVEKRGQKLTVVSWDLGDGVKLATADTTVEHYYEPPPTKRYNYFMIKAEVRIGDDQATLRTGFALYNLVAANRRLGYVVLAAMSHATEENDKEGNYAVTLRNVVEETAVVDELHRECLDGEGVAKETETLRSNIVVPGKQSKRIYYRLDKQACPGGARYEIVGHSADGVYKVGGLFGVGIPLPKGALPREDTPRRSQDLARLQGSSGNGTAEAPPTAQPFSESPSEP